MISKMSLLAIMFSNVFIGRQKAGAYFYLKVPSVYALLRSYSLMQSNKANVQK